MIRAQPACFKQHKTLKVAFRGGLGGGMAEAEAPEQRDMKLRKCIFLQNLCFHESRIQVTMLHVRKPTWMIYMFVGHFSNFAIIPRIWMVSEMAVWSSESFTKCNQYHLKSIWAPGKKITSWEDHCRLCTASAWQFGCPLCTPTSRPNYLQCHSQQLIRDWKIKVMLA